jgi:hypothetical protein
MAGLRGVALLLVLAPTAVGCGSHSAVGPVVPCVSVPLVGSNETALAPPPPRIVSARQHGQEMTVDIEVPAAPDECKPVAYAVKVTSTADQSNDGVQPGNQSGGDMPLHGRHLHLVFRPPILRLPPYVAIAELVARSGVDSKAVRRVFPHKGDYCLRHHSRSVCLIRAQYEGLRCMRGDVPRTGCTAWSYGSMRPRPVVPVSGASPEAVRENLREVLVKQTYNEVQLTALRCTRKLVCVATFARLPSEGVVRVRYVLTGSPKPGCWSTDRTDVIYPRPDRVQSPLQPYLPLNNQAWCLSWRKP